MPLDRPGLLNNNQLYAVTAYLLYLNGIIKQDKVINSSSLPKVNMPNRRGFINIYQQEIEND
jgi:cytochrome c